MPSGGWEVAANRGRRAAMAMPPPAIRASARLERFMGVLLLVRGLSSRVGRNAAPGARQLLIRARGGGAGDRARRRNERRDPQRSEDLLRVVDDASLHHQA